MSRLIDADALFKELNDNNIHWNRQINDIIMAQPTAYDVDKVVEELENGAYTTTDTVCGGLFKGIRLSSAIEIVRRGGVEHG